MWSHAEAQVRAGWVAKKCLGQKDSSGGKRDNIRCFWGLRRESLQGKYSVGFGQLIGLFGLKPRVSLPAGPVTVLVHSREHICSFCSLPPTQLPANQLLQVAPSHPSSSPRWRHGVWGGSCTDLVTAINTALVTSVATLGFLCAEVRH